ncbi:pirin family protein [Rufibacter hautae]|uniref:pirin family protein n=1 Tax=Rufibacter hautae TaxID=2595005 RepID=UPI001CC21803|nr:pirin-like C-terminal cupin domain-containing protein [Rufibacter hautae]
MNLPAKNKAESPEYLAVQAQEVPQKELEQGKGWIKVVAGRYAELTSQIPSYSEQFIYHLHLEAGQQFSLATQGGLEYAAFLLESNVSINGDAYTAGEFIEFDRKDGAIDVYNPAEKAIDLIIFGGESYTEPIVAEGPFVMNSRTEIAVAYRDFFNGKYGEIVYHN